MGQAALRTMRRFAPLSKTSTNTSGRPWCSVTARIEDGVDAKSLARADIAQPLLSVQIGIVSALRANGIVAGGHLGHSVGEIAAAWSAGALSLADAARVIVARSRSQQRTYGTGRMAALALGVRRQSSFSPRLQCAGDCGPEWRALGDRLRNWGRNRATRRRSARAKDLVPAARSRLRLPLSTDGASPRRVVRKSGGLVFAATQDKFASTVTGSVIENERSTLIIGGATSDIQFGLRKQRRR